MNETVGSVVVPAHNESAVIAHLLAEIMPMAHRLGLEVIVVANGCIDDTATVARSYGATVIELEQASKSAALNVGLRRAAGGVVIFADADAGMPGESLASLYTLLSSGRYLAGRPEFIYDTGDASWSVRAYFRARTHIKELRGHLWGATVYGASQVGAKRMGTFPDVVADDVWFDSQFSREEWSISAEPVVFYTPQSASALFKVLRRWNNGSKDPAVASSTKTSRVVKDLLASIRSINGAFDAMVYLFFALISRLSLTERHRWARDDTARERRRRASSRG